MRIGGIQNDLPLQAAQAKPEAPAEHSGVVVQMSEEARAMLNATGNDYDNPAPVTGFVPTEMMVCYLIQSLNGKQVELLSSLDLSVDHGKLHASITQALVETGPEHPPEQVLAPDGRSLTADGHVLMDQSGIVEQPIRRK